MVSEIRLFTRTSVAKAKHVATNPDEPAGPVGGGGFADWAMLALHAIRIDFGKSYRVTLDWVSEMPGVLEELGLTRLPHYTVFRNWFARIPTKTWRAFLDASVEKLPDTPLPIQQGSTVISLAATTPTVHTTVFEH